MSVSDKQLNEAVAALRRGSVIAYPTDTVYGLGADATNPEAVMKIRTIKQRVDDKPILALVADYAMLEEYAVITPLARILAERYLPGPLSLVLTASDERLAPIAGKDNAVGFRMPNHPVCTELARAFGRPITSTSFNKTGEPQATALEQMKKQVGQYADMIDVTLEYGVLPQSSPSTVVDARGEKAVVLREGAISKEQLRDLV